MNSLVGANAYTGRESLAHRVSAEGLEIAAVAWALPATAAAPERNPTGEDVSPPAEITLCGHQGNAR
jgi:hypothetical protein